MDKVLGYHVLNGINGKWLDADEHSWTGSFLDSASFKDGKLAQDVGEREAGPTGIVYVMACMGYC